MDMGTDADNDEWIDYCNCNNFSVETLNYTYALSLKHQVTPIAIAPNPL